MYNRVWSGIIGCAAACAVFLAAGPLRAEISVEGNVEARNQSGVHDGEVYRNYLKCDVDLRKNFGDTEVKVTLRAEDDTIRPDEDAEIVAGKGWSPYLRDDNRGPQRIYLREAFISHDININSIIDSVNLKMGRIIYSWGNADEVKPVDIINPQDYSNLYFTLLPERKYGVLSGSMTVFFTENFFIEGVVIPEFRPSEIASSVFVQREVRQMQENALLTLNTDGSGEPESDNHDNSYAGRLGLTVLDIDMHVSYYYGYDHLPSYEMQADPSKILPIPQAGCVTVTPIYHKIQMVGFDFQRALFWGIAIRGEGAYFERGKYFSYTDESPTANPLASPLYADVLAGGKGSIERDYIEYTAGFDDHDFIFDDLYLNVQFNQRIILDYDDTLRDEKYRNMILWDMKYSFFNQKVRIGTRGAYDIGDKSVYANAELALRLAEQFELMAGCWIVEGEQDTLIGQFDPYDMVYVAGRLTF